MTVYFMCEHILFFKIEVIVWTCTKYITLVPTYLFAEVPTITILLIRYLSVHYF